VEIAQTQQVIKPFLFITEFVFICSWSQPEFVFNVYRGYPKLIKNVKAFDILPISRGPTTMW